MSIEFDCMCSKHFSVEDRWAGRRVKCKACGEVIHVPMPEVLDLAAIEIEEPTEQFAAVTMASPVQRRVAAPPLPPIAERALIACPACRAMLDPDAAVCAVCRFDLFRGQSHRAAPQPASRPRVTYPREQGETPLWGKLLLGFANLTNSPFTQYRMFVMVLLLIAVGIMLLCKLFGLDAQDIGKWTFTIATFSLIVTLILSVLWRLILQRFDAERKPNFTTTIIGIVIGFVLMVASIIFVGQEEVGLRRASILEKEAEDQRNMERRLNAVTSKDIDALRNLVVAQAQRNASLQANQRNAVDPTIESPKDPAPAPIAPEPAPMAPERLPVAVAPPAAPPVPAPAERPPAAAPEHADIPNWEPDPAKLAQLGERTFLSGWSFQPPANFTRLKVTRQGSFRWINAASHTSMNLNFGKVDPGLVLRGSSSPGQTSEVGLIHGVRFVRSRIQQRPLTFYRGSFNGNLITISCSASDASTLAICEAAVETLIKTP